MRPLTQHHDEPRPETDLLAVLEALAGGGVRALPLKGPALAVALGRAPRSRPSRDIDLLVHRADRSTAVETLEALGYRALPRSNGLIREIHLVHPSALCVDLHWHLAGAEIGMPLDFDRLWAERRTLSLHGEAVPFPSLPWLVVITSFFAVRDLPMVEQRHLEDLSALVPRLQAHEWRQAAEIAGATRTRCLVSAVLRVCGAALRDPAQATFPLNARASAAAGWLHRRIAAPGAEEKARFATRLAGFLQHHRLREDLRDRLRPLVMLPLFLVLPDDVDAERAFLAGSSPWLERLTRVPEVAAALCGAWAERRRSVGFEAGLTQHAPLPRPAADVSLHVVGDAGLLLRAADQTLFGLSTAAAWLWCRLEEAVEQAALAREYAQTFAVPGADAGRAVQDSLRQWWREGLLEGAPRSPAEPCEEHDPPTFWRSVVPPPFATLRCRLLDQIVEIGLPDAEAAAAATALLGHLTSRAHPTIRLDVVTDAGGFAVLRDGMVVEQAGTRTSLAPQIKSAAIVAALNAQGFRLLLHAAMLRRGDAAILLPAVPGSGKTCLSAALARAGFAYHSDEVTVLDGRGLRARGVPVALTVKEPAWPILGGLYPEIDRLTVHHRIDGQVCRYLPPPVVRDDAGVDGWWPVRALVFPRFDAGATTRLEPLGKLDALQRLLAECLAIPAGLDADLVEDLAHWIEGIEAFALPFADLDDALAAISSCRALGGRSDVLRETGPVAAETARSAA